MNIHFITQQTIETLILFLAGVFEIPTKILQKLTFGGGAFPPY